MRKVADGIIAFFVLACLYLAFLSRQFDLNGIAEAHATEVGTLFSANHLLYRPLGLLFQVLLAAFGYHIRAVVVLQWITAVSGAAGAAFAYVFFRRISGGRFVSAAIAFWLGTSWAYWAYSTDAIYIPVATFFAAAGLAAFVCIESEIAPVVTGCLAAFGILLFQANVFLLPVFVLGTCLLKPAPRHVQFRAISRFLLASILPVSVVYVLSAFGAGVATPAKFLHWVTSHGSGTGLPMWGQLGYGRLVETAGLSISSVVPLRSAFGLAAYGALIIAAIVGLRRRMTQDGRAVLPMLLWFAFSYAFYLPFIIWWDPSPEWFIIPNLFLGAIFAFALKAVESTREVKAVLCGAICVIAAVNFHSTIWPRHSRPSQEMELAACVASHSSPSDVVLAADWSWDGYLTYFFGRSDLNFVKRFALSGDKETALHQVRQRIIQVQARNGKAYMMEPASYPKWYVNWLRRETGITLQDLTEFKGESAFQCQGRIFWMAPRSFGPEDIKRDVAVSLAPSSAVSLGSLDPANVTSVGYAELITDPTEPLSGFAYLDLHAGGSSHSEGFAPLSDPVAAARVFVDTDAQMNTAISLTNGNSTSSHVDFSFYDADGFLSGSGSLDVPARGQISRYVTEEPFSAKRPWTGTLLLRAENPISVVALRTMNTPSDQAAFSRAPIYAAEVMHNADTVVPLFAVGAGWNSEVVLVNPAEDQISGQLQYVFAGSPDTSTQTYSIPGRGLKRIPLPQSADLKTGYLRVQPETGSRTPLASVLLSRDSSEASGVQTSIDTVETSSSQVLYVQRISKSITTRVVIINPYDRTNPVSFQLKALDGTAAGPVRKLVLLPGQMWSSAVEELEESEGSGKSFEGLLSIQSETGTEIAALSLRYLAGEDGGAILSSIPPLNKVLRKTRNPIVFPQLVHGGGYTTHFVFFNAGKMQTKIGLRFFSSFGTPMRVPVRASTEWAASF